MFADKRSKKVLRVDAGTDMLHMPCDEECRKRGVARFWGGRGFVR